MEWKFWIDVLGWIGSIELLAAYLLVSSSRLNPQSGWYQFLNFKGSIFLLMNAAYYGAFPSSFLNIIWGLIALLALYRIFVPRIQARKS